MNVLVLNCGSSSAKFAVIDSATGAEKISGIAQRLDSAHATLDWKLDGQKHSRDLHHADHDLALRTVVELLRRHRARRRSRRRRAPGRARRRPLLRLDADHRGGDREDRGVHPARPAAQPAEPARHPYLQGALPPLPQVAVFDTAFHPTMPPRAYLYAVPYEWFEKHEVRRYGFHGTSHRYVSQQAVRCWASPYDHCLVTAHLGNGCSLAAVHDGKSVDTTMGLTPLDGVVMGTRSGSIDPSIIAHMKKALHRDASHVMDHLNKRSGLLGISGLSNDMRTLQEAAAGATSAPRSPSTSSATRSPRRPRAWWSRSAGSTRSSSPAASARTPRSVRAKVVELLGFVGISLDPELNAVHGKGHSRPDHQARRPAGGRRRPRTRSS